MPGVQISSLQAEHHESGFGIDSPIPRLSWRLENPDGVKDWKQASYEVRIKQRGESTVKVVEGEDNVLVPWLGEPLESREKVKVEVRARGVDGKWTESKGITIEAGLLEKQDWTAEVVGGDKIGGPRGPLRPIRVWGKFEWDGKSTSARLYATAYGIYTANLNGRAIGDQVLSPGWTSYHHNHRYQVYDISSLLVRGTNILSADLGEGWWATRLGSRAVGCLYGDRLGFMGQVEIDGKIIGATDKNWEWSTFDIELGEIYNGEVVDSNLTDADWWQSPMAEGKVEVLNFPRGVLQISDAPPVRRLQEIKAVKVITTKSGKTVLDFGQNLVGWLRIDENIKGDGELLIRHAEVMEHGELGTRPLRSAKAEITIKLGGQTKGYEPKFTFFGFRFAEISGPSDLDLSIFTAIVITSDLQRTGHFSCSHDMINQLHKNVVWSTLGNFVSLPTDCPQRDERLGWTGDIQVFANTANYLFDTSGFLEGWLRDVASETMEYNGVCPEVVPWMYAPLQPGREVRAMGIWADCTALTPWDLYNFFGDKEMLRKSFESMCAWLDKGVPRGANDLYDHAKAQFGDWLDPRAPPSQPAQGPTDAHMTCDAFLIYTTRVVARIASILGEKSQAKYEADTQRLLDTFQKEYITPSGRMMSDTHTALTLALAFDLFPSHLKARGVESLEYQIKWGVFKISTGFAGTPLILSALADNNLLHCAYRMLQEGDVPSWLYPITMGATTTWERWDSMLPDGSINPGQMTSFNHYALGAVAHFLHTVVGGLSANPTTLSDPMAPVGWKHALIRPQPGGTVTHAKTSFLSPFGLFRCEWSIESGRLKVEVEVPPNTTAKVVLPGMEEEIGSGVRNYDVEWVQDERWPPKAIQGPASIPAKDEFIP